MTSPLPMPERPLTPESPEAEVASAIERSLRTKLYYSTADDRGARDRLQAFAMQQGSVDTPTLGMDQLDEPPA